MPEERLPLQEGSRSPQSPSRSRNKREHEGEALDPVAASEILAKALLDGDDVRDDSASEALVKAMNATVADPDAVPAMANMSDILKKLTLSEKAMWIAQKEAATQVREAEGKVTEVTEGLMELKRMQEQELRVLRAQNEKKLRDAAYVGRHSVHKAQKDCATASAVAEDAEKRLGRSQGHVANLQQKIYDLEIMIQKKAQRCEHERAQVQGVMDGRLKRVSAQADGRILGMAEHAKEVCGATGAAFQTIGSELQDQHLRASIRAEGRARFKELRQLAKTWDHVDLTKDCYKGLKGDLIDLWHVQATTPSSPVNFSGESPPASPSDLNATRSPAGFGLRSPASYTGDTPSPSPSPAGYASKSIFGNAGDRQVQSARKAQFNSEVLQA